MVGILRQYVGGILPCGQVDHYVHGIIRYYACYKTVMHETFTLRGSLTGTGVSISISSS